MIEPEFGAGQQRPDELAAGLDGAVGALGEVTRSRSATSSSSGGRERTLRTARSIELGRLRRSCCEAADEAVVAVGQAGRPRRACRC